MLKESDNLYADTMLKTIGAQYYQKQGHWSQSLRASKKLLQQMGVNTKPILITDGSGLSRYNLINPNMLAILLNYAYKNNSLREKLIPALAEPGKKGTLRWRSQLKNMHMHAKTGSMTGVSSLTGYLQNKRKQNISFVIMINNFVGKNRRYRQMEDQVCQAIAKWS